MALVAQLMGEGIRSILLAWGLGVPLLLFALLYHYSRSLSSLTKGTARLPPGKFWQVPFLGETLQLLGGSPDDFMLPRLKKYGGTFRTHLFGKPAICTTSVEAAKFVLQSPSLFEQSWNESMKVLIGQEGIANSEGELHMRFRRIIQNSINPAALKKFIEDVDRAAKEQVLVWGESAVLNTHDELRKFTFRVILLFTCDHPIADTDSLRNTFRAMEEGLFSVPFNIPGTAYNKALKGRKKLLKSIHQLIKQRREDKENMVAHADLLDTLLNSVEHGVQLSDKQVADNIVAILFAGHDTSSTALAWTLYNLISYPDVLKQVKAENDALARERKHVDEPLAWDDLQKLPFTLKVIQETLRLVSIIPSIMRDVKEDVVLDGMLIPKGWKVFVWSRYFHLDPQLYPEPLRFNPSRFERQPKANSYAPFGGGQRVCPGSELSKQEMLIFLHRFLITYDFEPVGQLSRKVANWPMPRPRDGLPLKITKRSLDS